MSKMSNLMVRAQECPCIRRRAVRDPKGDKLHTFDLCEINDKYCLLETDLKCPEFEEIKREWSEEEALANQRG